MIPSLAYAGILFMVIGFIGSMPSIWPIIRRDRLFQLLCGFGIYLVILAGWATWRFPETAALQLKDTWSLIQLLLLLTAAWWLGAKESRITTVLLLAMLGFIVKSLYILDVTQWHAIVQGQMRVGLGMNIVPFGLYCATGVVGLVLMASRFWGNTHRPGQFGLRVLVWALCLGLLIEGVIVSQSRTTWLALALVLPPLLVWHLYKTLRQFHLQHYKRLIVGGLTAAGLVTAILVVNLDTFKQRFMDERSTINTLLDGDFSNIPYHSESSIGVRIHLYRHGFNKWKERPLFGWGPGSSKWLIKKQARKELRQWPHLHNTYIEVLVRIGIVGALFFVGILWLLLRTLHRAHQSGRLSTDIYLFLLGVFAMSLIWNVGEFRLVHADWQFYWLLFGGIAYTYALHNRHPQTSEH
ncbi:MAG: O-antigen ligase family protein [Gammaproteobacteria bacterium]|nr:O-antigen ligase family protein [Gammaproteobacteria bacterium]